MHCQEDWADNCKNFLDGVYGKELAATGYIFLKKLYSLLILFLKLINFYKVFQ
jgi:hypothetical protein